MNFKRKSSKQSRGGCLLCKPHKVMGNSKNYFHVQRTRVDNKFKEMVNDFMDDHRDVLTELAKR